MHSDEGQPTDTFLTRELTLATFLTVRGAELLGTKPLENSNFSMFEFADRERCKQLQVDYMNDADVPCRTYMSTLRELRNFVSGSGWKDGKKERTRD